MISIKKSLSVKLRNADHHALSETSQLHPASIQIDVPRTVWKRQISAFSQRKGK